MTVIRKLGLNFEGICFCSRVFPEKIEKEIRRQQFGFKFHFFLEPNVPQADRFITNNVVKSVVINNRILGLTENFLSAACGLLKDYNWDYILHVEDDAVFSDDAWKKVIDRLTVLKESRVLVEKKDLPIIDMFISKGTDDIKRLKDNDWNRITPSFNKRGSVAILMPRRFIESLVLHIKSYLYLNPNMYQLDTAMMSTIITGKFPYETHYPSLVDHVDISGRKTTANITGEMEV